jgi:hypothetical protein
VRRAALQLHIFCDGELVVWRELCWSGVWVKRRMNLKHVLSENADVQMKQKSSEPMQRLIGRREDVH